ncbi:RNA-binding domain superfamily [Arabidopsis thaliana x Arabidopsis arenosa]|uniref:RNA-binding domain superfamily n=1 Tax=Arabidopsis thaliana x Arabidopsis arenosa TaxID=1240361 RepID=A0A8T1YSW0_9BRAS|nr:RNA-binding domain superfamily [Arabidopsis thaliana x Arabidopsis arenosa]
MCNPSTKCGHIYFLGEGAVDKALQLNGSDVGGWNVTVKAHPFPTYANDSAILKVEGYETSLTENEIKTHLTQLFSPYGKIEGVFSGNGSATVSVRGEDVAVKAPQLNGSDIGGRKLTVLLLNGGISTVHERRKYGHHCPHRHLGT